MNAASANHICSKVTVPPKLQKPIIPRLIILAPHIAIIEKTQSKPPIMIPLTGYASPLKIWVNKTAGKITTEASLMATLLVRPRRIESRCRKVVNERHVATVPPINKEVLMRCRTNLALIAGECVWLSASSRANRVCTATATASQICVVANPN